MSRLVRWWIKRGPGSIGAIAKVMAQSYTGLRRRYPDAGHEKLLAGALARRNAIPGLPGNLSEREQQELLAVTTGRFAVLIEEIARLENPKGFENIPPETLFLARDVIREVLEEQIPGFDPLTM